MTMQALLKKIIRKEKPSKTTFLIVGLGNPGSENRNTRHNIGFMLVDRIAEKLGEAFSRVEFKALVTKVNVDDCQIILAKPLTYMNLSGQAVGSLLNFYKIPLDRMMVVYDDIDLPFGALRIRPGGGSGGHKGMNSIIDRLNSEEFPRLRMGIDRPSGKKGASGYVLQKFSTSEAEWLPEILERATQAVLLFIEQGLDSAMNRYNSSPEETAD